MNVIVIFRADATNYWVKSIVREMIRRNHTLYCYIYSEEDINIQAITDLNLKVANIDSLTSEVINKADFIFGADDTTYKIMGIKKPIITFNFAGVARNYYAACGDVMLVPNYVGYPKYSEECVKVTIGDTDPFCHSDPNAQTDQFLFIDSGHYPFGENGKKAVSQLILDICNKFPNHKVKVKPRFLKNDKSVTHRNCMHLYDCIADCACGKLPENLVLMDEYGDLNSLIDESSVVLCMYTTAFFKAARRGKKAIIIDNLPNEDSCNLTNEWHWKVAREVYEESGCLIDYREVLDHLPNGIKCRDSFLDKYIPFSDRTDCCEKAVDVIEFLYDNYFRKGKFLKNTNTDIINFRDDVLEDEEGSWDKTFQRRMKNEIIYRASRYYDELDQGLPLDRFLEWANEQVYRNKKWNESSIESLRKKIYRKRQALVVDNYDLLKGVPRKETGYYDALFNLNADWIAGVNEDDSACVRSLNYYKGLYYIKCRKIQKALECFEKYYTLTSRVEFDEVLTDKEYYLTKAKSYLIFKSIPNNALISIYGAGNWGNLFKERIYNMGIGNLICMFDRNYQSIIEDEVPVYGTDKICSVEFDYIIISPVNEKTNRSIKDMLLSKGIEQNKILSIYDID